MESRVKGGGYRAQEFVFEFWGSGIRVWGSRFRVQGLELRAQGLGFRIKR